MTIDVPEYVGGLVTCLDIAGGPFTVVEAVIAEGGCWLTLETPDGRVKVLAPRCVEFHQRFEVESDE